MDYVVIRVLIEWVVDYGIVVLIEWSVGIVIK